MLTTFPKCDSGPDPPELLSQTHHWMIQGGLLKIIHHGMFLKHYLFFMLPTANYALLGYKPSRYAVEK